MSEPKNRDRRQVLTVRLSPDEQTLVRQAADRKDVTLSRFVRVAVKRAARECLNDDSERHRG